MQLGVLALMFMAGHPRELGDVHFGRDFDAAIAESKRSGKPVLILFDEIPGCATCTGYGDTVLKQPLVVEAIETLFVPVAIYNNAGGKDREVLDSFGEPTWNNPVVRIVGADRAMLAPRVDGDYSPAGITEAMVAALEKAKRPVPEYLALLALESGADRRGALRTVLAMYCFWEGEACTGDIEGVVATRAGFLEGHEVVEVELDPKRTTYAAFFAEAKKRGCMSKIFARSDAEAAAAAGAGVAVTRTKDFVRGSEKDDKYRLAQTPWRKVPMTRSQATRANAVIATRDPSFLFSPRQIEAIRR